MFLSWHQSFDVPLRIATSPMSLWSLSLYTRWIKYDRDWLCVNKSHLVPVIFEPPCKQFQALLYHRSGVIMAVRLTFVTEQKCPSVNTEICSYVCFTPAECVVSNVTWQGGDRSCIGMWNATVVHTYQFIRCHNRQDHNVRCDFWSVMQFYNYLNGCFCAALTKRLIIL